MNRPFEGAPRVEQKDPFEKIELPTKARIVFDALVEAGDEGLTNAQLLEELTQHGLVEVADGYDEVPYKISSWDEVPEYDIDYVPRYRSLSVYDSDDVNDAVDLLMAKGLAKVNRATKRWVLSTPEKSWEKALHELPEVKLLKISPEEAKAQIRCYLKEAPASTTFVLGGMDVMYAQTAEQEKNRTKQHLFKVDGDRTIDFSVTFDKPTKGTVEQMKIQLSQESDEPMLLAIEAPEGTLRALVQIESGKELHLPIAELGFDPADVGGVGFRVMAA